MCAGVKKSTAYNPATFLYFYVTVQQDNESDEQGRDLRQRHKGVGQERPYIHEPEAACLRLLNVYDFPWIDI